MDNKEADKLFGHVVITGIVIVGILWLSGVFDGNKKSSSQIRVDVYSDCVDMGGRNCRDLLR